MQMESNMTALGLPAGARIEHMYAPPVPQDRLVRKEVALGTIREYEPPSNYIGLRFAPFVDVESDDVIFDYTKGLVSGLAPARAEDAESELAQKDETVGYGRAAIIDWALKDHYDPSDVSRYRETLLIQGLGQNLPLTVNSIRDGFEARLAKDERLRRLKLDNRIEWLITQALETSQIAYNDGKIKFTVSYGRPGDQVSTAGTLWSASTSDPIKNILDVQEAAYQRYGITLDRAITSRRVIRSILNSDKFNSQSGGNPYPFYTVQGWGPDAALERVRQATGIEFIEYDAVYRTRAIGGTTTVNNRFTSDNKLIFLPSEADVDALDDTIGFGATLTSPHVEGNWTSGFYEWEKDLGPDPWGLDRGTGIKAFPVFPHMDLTYVLTVL